MGLRGEAAIVGYVELPPERMSKASPAPFTLEQWAELGLCDVVLCALPARYITPMSEKKPRPLADAVFFDYPEHDVTMLRYEPA